MGFIKDNTGLFADKVNVVKPKGSPVNYVAAEDLNVMLYALKDIQAWLRGAGVFNGMATNTSDPAPAGVTNYLWLKADGTLWLTVNGSATQVGSGGGGAVGPGTATAVPRFTSTTTVGSSGIFDDLTSVSIPTRKVQLGPTAVPANNKIFVSLADAATTTMMFVQETDTNHVGQVGVNNEAICMVLDQRATFNTSADAVSASANGLTILVSSTRVAGTKPLINDGLIISVGGGDTNRAIYIPPGGGIISAGDGILSGPLTVSGDSSFSGGKIVATFSAGSSISLTGNITASGALTGGSAHITGNIKGDQEFIIDPSGTHAYFYIANAVSGATVNHLNISSAGNGGKVIFQGNNVGSNSGTGGIEVWGGNNGGTAKGGITGAGRTWGTTLGLLSSGITVYGGSATPNSNQVGSPGDLYLCSTAGVSTTIWTKESGSATNTGWVAVQTSTGGVATVASNGAVTTTVTTTACKQANGVMVWGFDANSHALDPVVYQASITDGVSFVITHSSGTTANKFHWRAF